MLQAHPASTLATGIGWGRCLAVKVPGGWILQDDGVTLPLGTALRQEIVRTWLAPAWPDGAVPDDPALVAWLEAHLEGSGRDAGRFVIAAALLTFGRLDALPVAVEAYPRGSHGFEGVMNALGRLVGAPGSLRPARDPEGLLRWTAARRLSWDPAAGRFREVR